jgi:hypothetical protein
MVDQILNNGTGGLLNLNNNEKTVVIEKENSGYNTFLFIIGFIISVVILYYSYQFFSYDNGRSAPFAYFAVIILALGAIIQVFMYLGYLFSSPTEKDVVIQTQQ